MCTIYYYLIYAKHSFYRIQKLSRKKLHVMTAKLSQQCKNTLRLENYQMHYIIKSTVQDF